MRRRRASLRRLTQAFDRFDEAATSAEQVTTAVLEAVPAPAPPPPADESRG